MFEFLRSVPLAVWLWMIGFTISLLPILIGFPGVTIFVWGAVAAHLFSCVLQRRGRKSQE
jgi:hypothetical protein